MKQSHPVDHPVHEFIQKRWSPRAFSNAPLPEETVLSLFEAARWAASCNNEQPWRFIYATKDDPERHARLFECLADGNRPWAKSAPLIVLTLVKTRFTAGGKPNPWALHDLGLAIGNLTTQASAMDLYVHNMAGFSVDKAKQSFALPEDLQPVTMIAIGRLGNAETLPDSLKQRELAAQVRKPLPEMILNG